MQMRRNTSSSHLIHGGPLFQAIKPDVLAGKFRIFWLSLDDVLELPRDSRVSDSCGVFLLGVYVFCPVDLTRWDTSDVHVVGHEFDGHAGYVVLPVTGVYVDAVFCDVDFLPVDEYCTRFH